MGIELTAEQKSISNLLSGRSIFKIPPYQRPYSWGKDECEMLFDDLLKAFEYSQKNDEKKSDSGGYFLGNIILSLQQGSDEYEVIDGQQRLTTLTIFLKILLGFDKNNQDLKNTIWLIDPRTGEKLEQRLQIKTIVGDENEHDGLKKVLDENYNECSKPNSHSNFENNIYILRQKVDELKKDNIANFIDFLLYDVTVLPILTKGNTTVEAREKALKIFETVNNRGMPLDDSDIFKSILYYKANRDKKEEDFIKLWKDFEEECNAFDSSKDSKIKLRIFRIYSYINRGKAGIRSVEKGLRDFYEKAEESPFKSKKTYNGILEDLNKILEALKLFENIRQKDGEELAKWFQLIDLYSNLYPKDTMVVYLFKKELKTDKDTVDFAKNLVKSIYSRGSTSSIKFDMYTLMVDIMNDKKPEPKIYKDNLELNYFGMLYKGFGLLGVYLNEKQPAVYPFDFLRIKDILNVKEDAYNYIGNSMPSNITLKNLQSNFDDIKFLDLKDMFETKNKNANATNEYWIEKLKNRYANFFGVEKWE